MHYFCTYFDRNYLYQGLALYESLRDHAGDFTLWVLCFDQVTYELLNRLNLPGLRAIRLADFEAAYPALAAVKADRWPVEYYWTTTPMLPLYVLNSQPQVEAIAYLDADLYFYSDLGPIYDEWGRGSMYIIPHRFAPQGRASAESDGGIYNVGYVGFRRDDSGLACLERWARQTLEWCHNRIEAGRLGDQKYLDDWPQRFSGVVISQNHGIGAGGWNIVNYQISQRDGQIYLDGDRLVMLHLNFVELLGVNLLRPRLFLRSPRGPLRPIYSRYAVALRRVTRQVKQIAPDFQPVYTRVSLRRWSAELVRGRTVAI